MNWGQEKTDTVYNRIGELRSELLWSSCMIPVRNNFVKVHFSNVHAQYSTSISHAVVLPQS